MSGTAGRSSSAAGRSVRAPLPLWRWGWTDCLLLEQNELTSGSTWHAAGNCPTFSTSWTSEAAALLGAGSTAALGDEVGYPINYHVTGSLRLAHTAGAWTSSATSRAMARAAGPRLRAADPGEARELYPFLELHDLEGALWDPLRRRHRPERS